VRVLEICLGVALCAAFMLIGLAKVLAIPASLSLRDRVGVPPALWTGIGVLEVLGAFGVVIGAFAAPGLGAAAAVGLTLVCVGAVVAQLRVRDAFVALVPPLVLGVMAVGEALLLATRAQS